MNTDTLLEFRRNEPAPEAVINDVEKRFGVAFPESYREFLLVSNGGEGPVGVNGYAMLWKVEELFDFNQSYEVEKYAHGLLLFGSDGGGEAFALDLVKAPVEFVSVPFVGMDRSLAQPLGNTFEAFIESLGAS